MSLVVFFVSLPNGEDKKLFTGCWMAPVTVNPYKDTANRQMSVQQKNNPHCYSGYSCVT